MPALILMALSACRQLGVKSAHTGCPITGNLMPRADLVEGWGCLSTVNPGVGAPGMEPATGWRVNGATDFAFWDGGVPGTSRHGSWDCRKERVGVWVRRVTENLLRLTYFYDFA